MPCLRLKMLVLVSFLTPVIPAQELTLSTAAKTYTSEEDIWVNLSVNNASALPGAYTIAVSFNADNVSFKNTLPADDGPFSIIPAASAQNGVVTVAGFQGIVDTGPGTASLATLVFVPASGPIEIDTSSFAVNTIEVFFTQAEEIQLPVVKQATSVLQPSTRLRLRQNISLVNGYLRFTVLNEGLISVHIFDLGGRTVAVPLRQSHCTPGGRAVPIGTLRSGIYIVAVRGPGSNAVKRVEVVK